MRIDLMMKYLCLVKSRALAKTLCDAGRVIVAGRVVRPAALVSEGSRITIQFRRRTLSIELIQEPRKQLSKTAAVDYYRPVETPSSESRLMEREQFERDHEVDLDDFDGPV